MHFTSKDFRHLRQAAQIADAQRELMLAQPRSTDANDRRSGIGLIAATLTFMGSFCSGLFSPDARFQLSRLPLGA
jgi:hypothetical protein